MKTLITTLTLLVSPMAYAGWFSDDNGKIQQQLQHTQQQLVQQQTSTGNWQVVAGILAIGCIVLFVIGTAFGSKARREARRERTTD